MLKHKKQFCCIAVKSLLCFHPYADLRLNCTARSSSMIYYSCDCLTLKAAAESPHCNLAAATELRKSV